MQSTITALRARVLSLGASAADGKNIVAFSGGVDSSLVAALVHQVFPGSSRACVGVSSALPAAQLDLARSVARHIGRRSVVVFPFPCSGLLFLAHRGASTWHARNSVCSGIKSSPTASSLSLSRSLSLSLSLRVCTRASACMGGLVFSGFLGSYICAEMTNTSYPQQCKMIRLLCTSYWCRPRMYEYMVECLDCGLHGSITVELCRALSLILHTSATFSPVEPALTQIGRLSPPLSSPRYPAHRGAHHGRIRPGLHRQRGPELLPLQDAPLLRTRGRRRTGRGRVAAGLQHRRRRRPPAWRRGAECRRCRFVLGERAPGGAVQRYEQGR